MYVSKSIYAPGFYSVLYFHSRHDTDNEIKKTHGQSPIGELLIFTFDKCAGRVADPRRLVARPRACVEKFHSKLMCVCVRACACVRVCPLQVGLHLPGVPEQQEDRS